ncbi:hypothetical protein MIND_01117600 [Mycena indigotica]|uniref:Uncharacterized protein n=1 Tax=Mycena indigotica TaxID=2126181 RepID=A0A8H6S5V5_9AGAR|nr:uncharacterized protein MIND_01117600 [Mycena indigotica]KAF7293406.1 hypothetical protein MIND_01117600 [Mycena indigotica]
MWHGHVSLPAVTRYLAILPLVDRLPRYPNELEELVLWVAMGLSFHARMSANQRFWQRRLGRRLVQLLYSIAPPNSVPIANEDKTGSAHGVFMSAPAHTTTLISLAPTTFGTYPSHILHWTTQQAPYSAKVSKRHVKRTPAQQNAPTTFT